MSDRYFSRTGNGRGWRKGRFDIMVLPLQDGTNAVFPEEFWGTEMVRQKDLPEHLASVIYRVPEGTVVVSRCTACGGRQEHLIDLRRAFEEVRGKDLKGPADLTPEIVQRTAKEVENALAVLRSPITKEWVEKHKKCTEEPIKHYIPSLVSDFIDSTTRLARKILADGDPIPGNIYILLADGRAMAIPIHDLPGAATKDRSRTIEVQRRFFSVREMVRARKMDILAAVVFSEAWGSVYQGPDTPPPSVTKQEEFVVVMLTTENFGAIALSPIRRKSGVIGEGPGEFDDFEWQPMSGEALLVDGLLATTGLVPQSEEDAKRGAGIIFSFS